MQMYTPTVHPLDAVDYRMHRPPILSGVRDQQPHDVCWAVSAVAAIESAYRVKGISIPPLSAQHLIDGCQGLPHLTPMHAFEFVMKTGGLALESDYPFVGVPGELRRDLPLYGAIDSYVFVPPDSEHLLKCAISEQPIIATLHVTKDLLKCKKEIAFGVGKALDRTHSMLLCGYGSVPSEDPLLEFGFWIAQNSWGLVHGDNGYSNIVMKSSWPDTSLIIFNALFPVIRTTQAVAP